MMIQINFGTCIHAENSWPNGDDDNDADAYADDVDHHHH